MNEKFVFWFKFHGSLFLRVQLTITKHWLKYNGLVPNRRQAITWNITWPYSLTHIYGTRGRWVNTPLGRLPLRLSALIHCSLVKPYGDTHLSQYLCRCWLIAWRHQAITWTNVDFLLLSFFGIHAIKIPQRVHKLPICISIRGLKIILYKMLPHLSEANELIPHLSFHRACVIPTFHGWRIPDAVNVW